MRCAMARWNSNGSQLLAVAALLVVVSTVSNSEAVTFDCTVTLTRVLVRDGQDWKELTNGAVEHTMFRELSPAEKRGGNTWGFFLPDQSKPAALCKRFDTAISCGSPGNTIDFNLRTGRYVRTYFASFLTRASNDIFVEAGRCSTEEF
jgi:hypothetical protein